MIIKVETRESLPTTAFLQLFLGFTQDLVYILHRGDKYIDIYMQLEVSIRLKD